MRCLLIVGRAGRSDEREPSRAGNGGLPGEALDLVGPDVDAVEPSSRDATELLSEPLCLPRVDTAEPQHAGEQPTGQVHVPDTSVEASRERSGDTGAVEQLRPGEHRLVLLVRPVLQQASGDAGDVCGVDPRDTAAAHRLREEAAADDRCRLFEVGHEARRVEDRPLETAGAHERVDLPDCAPPRQRGVLGGVSSGEVHDGAHAGRLRRTDRVRPVFGLSSGRCRDEEQLVHPFQGLDQSGTVAEVGDPGVDSDRHQCVSLLAPPDDSSDGYAALPEHLQGLAAHITGHAGHCHDTAHESS